MTRKAYSNYLITSDPHFENDYILDIERGNKFKTIQEHDDTILNLYDRWMDKLDKKKERGILCSWRFWSDSQK